MRKIFSAITLTATLWGLASAQTSGDPRHFEVASIRRSDPNVTGATMRFLASGALSISGMSIKNMITLAYGMQDYQVSGGPKWLGSEFYDVQAKPPADGPPLSGQALMHEQMLRIQELLADRCHLKVHREARSATVYQLSVVKTGLKMREAASPNPDSKTLGTILPWEVLVADLSRRLDRPLVDKTGLRGAWYVKLEYTSDDGRTSGIGVKTDPTKTDAERGPSIFTAMQEQLGLRLDAVKGLVDQLVIDSVERPGAN